MNTTGVHKKTRTKLEKILRQDHSDVYFDNEKLNEELNRLISSMERQMHHDDQQRGIEIYKLRKEIGELKSIRTKSAEQQVQEISQRPQTAAGGFFRKQTVPSKQRAKTALGRSNGDTLNTDNSSEDSDKEEDDDNQQRPVTPLSEASTLRNPKTLKKYRVIDPNCFKENNRFPEDWYTKCLPASDAAIYNARKKVRGKSAPSRFGLLGQLRDKERSERNMMSFKKHKLTNKTQDNMTDASGLDRMSLVCEEPVKPVLMSRRRLKELSNIDNLSDRGPSRNTVRKQGLITQNEFEVKQIDCKVRDFCRDIEELKAKEKVEMQEREEAIRREAQEKVYLNTIDLDTLEQPDEQSKDGAGSDDENIRNRRRLQSNICRRQ